MAQLYLRHSRSRTHGSTCYEISAKFANEKTPGHCPGFCFDRRNASAYELRVALVMRFALLPKRTSASACVVHLTSQLSQVHHRTARQRRGSVFRRDDERCRREVARQSNEASAVLSSSRSAERSAAAMMFWPLNVAVASSSEAAEVVDSESDERASATATDAAGEAAVSRNAVREELERTVTNKLAGEV